MPERLNPILPMMLLLSASAAVSGEEVRYAEHDFAPQSTSYVNRDLGKKMVVDGLHLVCGLKNPAAADGGAVVFMRRTGGTGSWLEIASFGGPADGGVDIGSTLAIGGIRALATETEFGEPPEVTLYRYSQHDDDWSAHPDLVDRPMVATDEFGSSLAVDGDLLLVGDPGAGRVHVYRDLGADVVFRETIFPVSADASSFGHSVAVSDGVIVVGDPENGVGRVDLFAFDADSGTSHLGAVVSAGAGLVEGDRFGDVLAIDGDVLAIGATRPGALESGFLGIHERSKDGAGWPRTFASGTVDGLAGFPSDVAVRGGMVVAGAPGTLFGGDGGKMMVFRRSGEVWSFSETLGLPGSQVGTRVGATVAIATGEVVAGLPGRSQTSFPFGRLGGLISCSVDCDLDGTPDVEEIELGLEVDYDRDGVPDYCELDEYVLVPLDYSTIQAAIEDPLRRTILIQPGVFSEEVVIDGRGVDIRAFDPEDRPVWSTGIASGVAIEVSASTLRLESLILTGNRQAVLSSDSRLRIENCDLTDNGYGTSVTESELVASGCLFARNDGAGNGGSAIIGGRARLNLSRCDFTDNGGNSNPFSPEHGGGAIRLVTDSNGIVATECTFLRNAARVDHLQIPSGFSGDAIGGAIYATGLSVAASFDSCTFTGNISESSLQQTPSGSAAGNYAASAALDLDVEGIDVSITDCVFSDNEVIALDNAGSTGFIGASTILVDGLIDDSFSITQSTVRSTILTARYPGDVYTDYPTDSISAIDVDNELVNIIGSTFEDIGGISVISPWDMEINVSGSTFDRAGHVVLQDGASCSNSEFVDTSLAIGGNVSSCSFERYQSRFRPVVRFFGGFTESRFLTVTDFHQIDGPAVVDGGTAAYPLQVAASTICGNSAPPFSESSVWNNTGGNVIEGGLGGASPCPSAVVRTVPGTHATIDEALLAANNGDTLLIGNGAWAESLDARGFAALTIAGTDGGACVISPPDGLPGILFSGEALTVRDLSIDDATVGIDVRRGAVGIVDVLIENCTAPRGAAVLVGAGSPEDGGGASVELDDVLIRNNEALIDGGGVHVGIGGAIRVLNSEFTGNVAAGSGGGVFLAEGARSCTMVGTDFDSNIAAIDGGGVFAGRMPELVIQAGDFSGNAAGRFGGGLHLVDGSVQDCDFIANTAAELGGGARSTGNSLLRSCDFRLNVAGLGGGLAATAVETFVGDFSACGNVGGDWYGNVLDDLNVPLFCSDDCNGNGTPDADEIAGGIVEDCNGNTIPDECEDLVDVDQNGIPDECDREDSQQVRIASIGSIDGLSGDATGVLLRPLFRDGARTHDVLVLDPTGSGAIARVIPDEVSGYRFEEILAGTDFERCCATLFDPVGQCINNGPAGASEMVFARGDLVLPHPTGDTGLFDENLEMYYGCDAPAGAGLPSPITDYDLAPSTNRVTSLRYGEDAGGNGLAGAEPAKKSQVLVSAATSSTNQKPSSSRKGSGQGGTGPYPGVDQTDEFGLSIAALDSGDFNGDGDDDLVLLHPDEDAFSIRYFTGLVDLADPDTGETVPSGATWSPQILVDTTHPGLDLVCGQFVDLPGVTDDGLVDVAVVIDAPSGPTLRIWAGAGGGVLTEVGSAHALLSSDFRLERMRVTADGMDVILLAQSDGAGNCYLDHLGWDPDDQDIRYDFTSLGVGSPAGLSSGPENFGVSSREIAAVLVDRGATSSLFMFELSLSRPAPAPVNDSCDSPVVIEEGLNAFSTTGATTSGAELPANCWSDGQTEIYRDVWYQWTATCTGEVTVSTCGTADFDTWLAVYSGGCEGVVIGCNDEDPECSGNTSRASFAAAEGVTYLVRVGSWSPQGNGEGELLVSCPGPQGDLTGDGLVDGADLSLLLGGWGLSGATDLDGDGVTGGADLAILLGGWS